MSVLTKKYFHDEAAAFVKLESVLWPNGPVCPHCGADKRVYELNGVRSKPSKKNPEGIERFGLKKCGACRKQFTVRIGTVFEDSPIPLHKWLQAFYLMCSSKKGISSHQLHRILRIKYQSAWFMSHRIREAMRSGGFGPMGGEGEIIEIDETIYGRAATHPKGRRSKEVKITNSAHKNVIVSLVQRSGGVRSYHVAGSTVMEVIPLVNANIKRETDM